MWRERQRIIKSDRCDARFVKVDLEQSECLIGASKHYLEDRKLFDQNNAIELVRKCERQYL